MKGSAMRVAVIGAGVVGAAVARELTRRGADVTVFEREHPGAGTSGTSFSWINAHRKEPEAYHQLNLAGCEEHRRLAELPGGTAWYFSTGNLEWAEDAVGQRRLDERLDRLAGLGYPFRLLDRAETRRFEPDVRVPYEVERVAFFPDEAYVLPLPLLARLLGEAADGGAAIRWPVAVSAVDPSPSDGVDVVFDGGSRERFDTVVTCAGLGTTEVIPAGWAAEVPLVDASEPGGAAVGFLAYTVPVPARLSRVLTTPALNVRPDGGGRLVLQARDLDGTADPASPPAPDSAVAGELLDRLGRLLVRGSVARVDAVRVGQRVLPADGQTIAGPVDELGRVYTVATHSGITLAPLLGRLVAGELAGGDRCALLDGFRPSRFPVTE